jgi:hypothetical protein
MIGRLHYASRGTALGRGNRDAARLLGTEPAPATSVAGFRAALAQTIGESAERVRRRAAVMHTRTPLEAKSPMASLAE